MTDKKIEITSFLPQTRFISSVDGKHYIVPAWIEIPKDFDFKTDLIWTKQTFKQDIELAKVKASRGDTIYTISKTHLGEIKCSCSGFKYKKSCKHSQEFKLKSLLGK